MAENSANLSAFGGLMKYEEEFPSLFNLKPTHVMLFIALIITLRISLGVIFT